MDGYIPSIEEVRDSYVIARDAVDSDSDNGAEFDRWLAAHDAEVRREALEQAADNVPSLIGTGNHLRSHVEYWLRVLAEEES